MPEEPRREGASDAAAALAVPGEFEWGGRAYKVSPVTLAIEARFSQRLIERTYAALGQARQAMGEDAFREAIRQLNDDVACYELEYGGRIGRKALNTLQGQQELAYLCMAARHPEITRDFLTAVWESAEGTSRLLSLLHHQSAVPKNGQAPPAARGQN